MINKVITITLLITSVFAVSRGYIDTGLILLVMMGISIINEKIDRLISIITENLK